MNKDDFIFNKLDDKFQDYWFNVHGDSQTYLTDKYMEQSMVAVTEVVYSKIEDMVGIKRLFPFNKYVEVVEDEELKDIIKELIEDEGGE